MAADDDLYVWPRTMVTRTMPYDARKRGCQFGMLLSLAVAAVGVAQEPQPGVNPSQSAHKPGPDGLEGWTLDWPLAGSGYGDERFAFTLIVASYGHIVRRISGDPIIWTWIFWSDGRQVAYETGPFHFSDTCLLIRLSDGRQLDNYDCYHGLPADKPDWVRALEKTE